ncbi:phage tail tape measure protein, partial [Streptomyces camponoticapitis]|uniref:phage tail tape measure protein n=1 Tax=Streptomyces camponoticapitis TaxID=1616125 RepID=UPI001665A126
MGPAADAGSSAGEAAGSGLSDSLKVGAAAAGIAAGALLTDGITEALEQSNITSNLQAQLGTTGGVAAAQGKVAGKLFSSGVAGSFQEAADAIKAVVQGGLAPPDATEAQLQKIATKASDVANVFGQDLGGVTNAVSQMMRTGLAKNSTEAFDLITKGFQGGADKGGDFLDTMNEYGTQFRKLGIDGPAAIGLINQGLKGGARDADIVADSIKEFSIRAIDGSKTTADGFKALGLDAGKMADQIGAGGKGASLGLDTVLDKLRGIKDPVKQAAAATALFGTQSEDLGKALFDLDPSKAAGGLGKFGGAADKVGKTIRSGPSHEISVFTRGLKQGFVDMLGGTVLPIISDVAGFLRDNLGPATAAVGDAFGATVNWFKEWGIWLAPLGILIGGIALALGAQAIASGLATAALWVQVTALGAAQAVAGGFAAVMGVVNAVMAINPFVLVAIAVVALGAALVIAYQRSETFRNIVMIVWESIQTAISFAWNSVIKPAFGGILDGLKAIGSGAAWLWSSVIKPSFSAIGTLGKWLWNSAIKPAFNGIRTGISAVGTAGVWLWQNSIKPAFNGVRSVISGVWNNGIKPVFNALKTAVRLVGESFGKAKDAIKIAWDKLKSIARGPVEFIVNTVYGKGIRPTWNAVAKAFGAPSLPAVKFARGGVLPGYTPGRDPHKFYSPTGGALEMSGGEAIMRPEFTRAVGSGFVGHMNKIARTRGAGGVKAALAPVFGGNPNTPTQRFADGGIFGWIGKTVSGAGSAAWDGIKKTAGWLKDGMEASARAGVQHVVDPLLRSFPGMDTGFGQMIRKIPTSIIDALFGYSKEADKRGAGGIGGPRVQKALSWARTQAGKKYQWGGNGNPSWD